MSFSIGLDIGGTKIAGAIFDADGQEHGQKILPTPQNYADFLAACLSAVTELEVISKGRASVGIGLPGAIDHEHGRIFAPNIPCLRGQPFQSDIEKTLNRSVVIGNDASCAALSEAVDGAADKYRLVFGVIMGTGVGGGFIVDKRIIEGPNGSTGEWGHVPLPFQEETDGPRILCGCGQTGCIEKFICGAGLSRLHEYMSGEKTEALHIAERARIGDVLALKTLDRFYTVVAKAMIVILHTFDPEIIVISGGLNDLPGMYENVPKRWGQYALRKDVRTSFVQAQHGAVSGVRGAAWLGRKN